MPRIPHANPCPTALLGLAIGLLAAPPALAQGDQPGGVAATRATVEKWVETRRILSKEKRDWEEGRELLHQRIEVVKHEIAALRGRIAEAETSIGESEKKQAALTEERDRLQAASAGLAGIVASLEERVRKLLARLPETMRERVKVLSQRLPAAVPDDKTSLGDRFMTVIGILNEVNKLDGEVSVGTEVRALADGSCIEVTTLYVGIGHGFYVSAKGDVAGVGMPSQDGWTWTPANDAAPAIKLAIAVFRSEQVAQFVRLPVRIQ